MDDDVLQALLVNERYPRSGAYSARWMVENAMGPNPVWLTEALTGSMRLEPGMRVLDMGCGTALSSIFLAREFGVQVWATDLWVSPAENWARIMQAGVQDRVQPVHAEAHALPFAEGFFDALLSVDAYHYFGTDDLYIGYFSRFVKPGGLIGVIVPSLAEEPAELPPPSLEPYWKWDFCAWHSPAWWKHHWNKTGVVRVEIADRLPEGWRDWLQWNEACDRDGNTSGEEADMLRVDGGRLLGFVQLIAHRT